MEKWKDIIGYEGLYQVSNYGNIKSLSFGPKNININRPERLLHISYSSIGYAHVQLYKNGKAKTMNVHRLVATAFVDNPFNKPEINHIDANRSNNHADNLEWVTHSENLRHAVKLGNRIPPSVKNNKKGKSISSLHILQYSLNGTFIKEWNCISDISFSTGIPYSGINSCVNGLNKSSGGYMWIRHMPGCEIREEIEPRISLTGKAERSYRKIAQYNLHGDLIKIWNGHKEIETNNRFGKRSIGNIYKCINGKRKTANGFIWKYI